MLIPRRMLGFGFALFLMLVILAVIYSQYALQSQPNLSDTVQPKSTMNAGKKSAPTVDIATTPLPTTVTPETAANDLIDEALADRDDLSASEEDEMADLENGN
ncbi:MAG: hypothetical protein WAT84_01610 [Candidatus Moraniibacteriota bacterium]